MRSTIATCLVCIVFCGLFPSGGAASPSGQARLLKVVALSHLGPHVPRIPHVSVQNENLPRWSEKPWPRWPAPAGSLTPRGARLITAMWEDLRAHFFNLGLLPEEHCPSPFRVFARADATLTAQDTARAILDGLFPACGLPCAVSSRRPDPLFEPVRAGLDRFDPAQVAGGIMRAAGGNMDTLRDSHNAALTRIGQALGPLPTRYCTRFNLPPDCALTSVPGMVSVAADGSDVSIGGGLEAGVIAAENFLQEYIQWPDSPAGWGRMDAPALREALALHSTVLNVVNRTPRVAQAKGGSLLAEMAATLAGEHTDPRCNAASLVIFVGNDNHLTNVGALLGLFWRISGYPDNSVPPGAVLLLELWEQDGLREVRANLFAQTLETLHADFASPPSAERGQDVFRLFPFARTADPLRSHAPVAAAVTVPPVLGGARFSLDDFSARVRDSLKDATLAPQEAAPLVLRKASGTDAGTIR